MCKFPTNEIRFSSVLVTLQSHDELSFNLVISFVATEDHSSHKWCFGWVVRGKETELSAVFLRVLNKR